MPYLELRFYFTEGEAVVGSEACSYEWNGATWQFSRAENMEKFAADPQAYAPQYGGDCAKAMSEGNLGLCRPPRLENCGWQAISELQRQSAATMAGRCSWQC